MRPYKVSCLLRNQNILSFFIPMLPQIVSVFDKLQATVLHVNQRAFFRFGSGFCHCQLVSRCSRQQGLQRRPDIALGIRVATLLAAVRQSGGVGA